VFAASQLRRLGVPVPVELLRQLRSGRGLDNRRLKASGFSYRYTTRETVLKLRAHQRLRPLLGTGDGEYRYEREVEEFLRRSPNVQTTVSIDSVTLRESTGPYDDLSEGEVIEIIGSLETEALHALRRYERAHGRRRRVIQAVDQSLARRGATVSDEQEPEPSG
jgi:UDP-glucose 4-epimerase